MRPAFRAEFTGHGALEVAAAELLWLACGVFESTDRHRHEHVRSAARDVLAFAAVALRSHHRLAFRLIAHLAAIASAFEFHDVLPVLLSLFRRRGPALANLFCPVARFDIDLTCPGLSCLFHRRMRRR